MTCAASPSDGSTSDACCCLSEALETGCSDCPVSHIASSEQFCDHLPNCPSFLIRLTCESVFQKVAYTPAPLQKLFTWRNLGNGGARTVNLSPEWRAILHRVKVFPACFVSCLSSVPACAHATLITLSKCDDRASTGRTCHSEWGCVRTRGDWLGTSPRAVQLNACLRRAIPRAAGSSVRRAGAPVTGIEQGWVVGESPDGQPSKRPRGNRRSNR